MRDADVHVCVFAYGCDEVTEDDKEKEEVRTVQKTRDQVRTVQKTQVRTVQKTGV